MTAASLTITSFLATRKMSLRELARRAGVSAPTIHRILQGGSPSASTLAKLRTVRGLGSLRPEDFGNGAGQ